MKKQLLLLLFISLFFSCKQTPKDYVTISGLIANNKAQYIDINHLSFNKRIAINLDGTFKDTLKVYKSGYFKFTDGKNKTTIHLKNGDELNFQYDYDDFQNSVVLNGKGIETTQYLLNKRKLESSEGLKDIKSFFKYEPKEFNSKINKIEKEFTALLEPKGIDSVLKLNEISRNTKTIAFLKKNYAKEHEFNKKFAKGNESPVFTNYISNTGKKVSLTDFKGKFVYIDVWATWCGPCKREIKYLKQLTEDYKNKNIAFISITVDNGRGFNNNEESARKAWHYMIKNRKMDWIQLYADKAWNSDFIKAYGIRSIPRFILIDDKGKIVNANAPRPSNKQIRQILDNLLN